MFERQADYCQRKGPLSLWLFEAKVEIRFRSLAEREDPDKILTILKELYLFLYVSFVSLQKQFFDRKQKDGESLKEFSHSLRALMENVQRAYPDRLNGPDILVRDQIVENVHDVSLRRELKSSIRQHPSISFLALRQEAIKWVEEGERPLRQTRLGLHRCWVDVKVEGACHAVERDPSCLFCKNNLTNNSCKLKAL